MWPSRDLLLSPCSVFPAEQVFWEVMQLRREMSFAKLGYYKDQLWPMDSPALQSQQTLPWRPALPLVLVFLLSSGPTHSLLLAARTPTLCVSVFLWVWENNCGYFQSSQKRLKDCDVSGLLSLLIWSFGGILLKYMIFALLKHVTLQYKKTTGMKRS